jgi:Chaperone of endosialidase
MGQLVFQANSGGQTNLVGQNTASTFNLNIPLANGTLVSTGDTATVTSTMIAGPVTTAKGGTGLTSFTANGVVFASSTSALTTGSALTFSGSTFSVTGSGIFNDGRNGAIQYGAYTTALNRIVGGLDYSGLLYGVDSGYSHYWQINNSEQMRLTSTGLGIGTSSPTGKLGVNGDIQVGNNSSTGTSGNLRLVASGGNCYIQAGQNNGGSNAPLLFTNNGASSTWMTLDTSGNLGLGVTPSAWTIGKVLQLGNGASILSYSNISYLNANAYFDGSWKYIANGTAGRVEISDSHKWFSAASGTAGNAISFTQAMTLDNSGNLEIGGTFAQGRKLAVDSATNGYTMQLLQTSAYSSGNLSGTVYSGYYDGSNITDMASIRGGKENTTSGNYAGMLAFYTRSNGGSDTERARIDSSGNFLIGTTSASGNNSNAVFFQPANGAGYFLHASGTSSGTEYAKFFYNGNTIGSITQSGTTAVLYNLTSDQRLKENIVDAPEFGNVIDSIQVRSYDWKADHTHQRAGFIAQELVTVAPEAVHQPADPEEMMAVDYSKLVPMLVKEIQSLRARLKAANIA